MLIMEGKNISKTYGDKNILNDICLSLYSGDFTHIKGDSGTGKSTLLYILGGLLSPSRGQVFLEGKDIFSLKQSKKSLLIRDNIGIIYQDSYIIEALTVYENLKFIQKNILGCLDLDRIDFLLESLGLSEKKDAFSNQLSGGEKRRAMIASVLIKEPRIILADEPTNDLNPKWIARILDLLYQASQSGAGVILISHLDQDIKYINKNFSLLDGKLTYLK